MLDLKWNLAISIWKFILYYQIYEISSAGVELLIEHLTTVIGQVALKKSCLILMIALQNEQTFQLFSKIIKTESVCKSN